MNLVTNLSSLYLIQTISLLFSGVIYSFAFLFPNTLFGSMIAWVFSFYLAFHFRVFKNATIVGCFLAGFFFNFISFVWLPEVIMVFTSFSLSISWILFFLFCSISSLPFCVFGFFASRPCFLKNELIFISIPALWTLKEIFFPVWTNASLGTTQNNVIWLIQVADIGGAPLIGFIMMFTACMAVGSVSYTHKKIAPEKKVLRFLPVLFLLLLFVFLYGSQRISSFTNSLSALPSFNLGVIQPNTKPQKGYAPETRDLMIHDLQEMSLPLITEHSIDMLIWPESSVFRAYDYYISRFSPGPDEDPFPGLPVPLLFGTLLSEMKGGEEFVYNAALLRKPDGSVGGSFIKNHLFPFSEYFPFETFVPTFVRDHFPKRSYPTERMVGEQKGIPLDDTSVIHTSICYDDMWRSSIHRTCDQQKNSILLTLTNDSWFGGSLASRQHYMISYVRAVEARRHVVRVTVDGITAWISPIGVEVEKVKPHTKVSHVFKEVPALSGSTFYACYGDLPLGLLLTVVLLSLCFFYYKNRALLY
jgi:apolipoprotein N-acyltransferase